jgi:hypothetical protein
MRLAEGGMPFIVGKRENINRFEVEFGIKR